MEYMGVMNLEMLYFPTLIMLISIFQGNYFILCIHQFHWTIRL